MELKELKKLSVKELHTELAQLRGKLRDMRFKDANRQLKDVRSIRKIRTDIARILTLLNSGRDVQEEKKQDKN